MRVFSRGAERLEIELVEATIITRRIVGGAVVEQGTRTCSSTVKAKWDADRLCRDQIAAGFERIGGTDDIAAPSQAELVAAIRANPDDLDSHLVYADWLTDRGDPWGQVIAVQHALETLPRFGQAARRDELERAEVELMFRHSARLWGALGELIVDEARQKYACDLLHPEWRCGFLRSVQLDELPSPDLVATLLDRLATLEIAIVLRSMALSDPSWPSGTLEAVTRHRWPCLEVVAISDASRGLAVARLRPLLDGSAAPRLVQIAIGGTVETDAICRALAASPLAPQLRSLQLLDGEFGRPGIAALAGGRFTALRELKLTGTGLPLDARDRLAHVAPSLLVVRTDEDDDHDY